MKYKNSRLRPPDVCPVCGEAVPQRALACPECGADHNSGWRLDAETVEQDLPDKEFDYDDFVRREFAGRGLCPAGMHPVWWITAMVLLLALLLGMAWLVF